MMFFLVIILTIVPDYGTSIDCLYRKIEKKVIARCKDQRCTYTPMVWEAGQWDQTSLSQFHTDCEDPRNEGDFCTAFPARKETAGYCSNEKCVSYSNAKNQEWNSLCFCEKCKRSCFAGLPQGNMKCQFQKGSNLSSDVKYVINFQGFIKTGECVAAGVATWVIGGAPKWVKTPSCVYTPTEYEKKTNFFDPNTLVEENSWECVDGKPTCLMHPKQHKVMGSCVEDKCKANDGGSDMWVTECYCNRCHAIGCDGLETTSTTTTTTTTAMPKGI